MNGTANERQYTRIMFTEEQLLPISALQHLLFCERQCALIHVERLWVENRLTVEGQHLHKKVHDEGHCVRDGVAFARGLSIRSFQLGDIVEFHPGGSGGSTPTKPCDTSQLVIPIEYKRGKPKKDDSDRVQLCAQALCLEEMLSTTVPNGYLFYGKRKRRTAVEFDDSLRNITTTAIRRLREMIDNRETPTASRQPKCDACSLVNLCLPDAMRLSTGVGRFVQRQIDSLLAADGPLLDDIESDDIESDDIESAE